MTSSLSENHLSDRLLVAKRLKRGPNHYAVTLTKDDGTLREYVLLSSTRQLDRKKVSFDKALDGIPSTWHYRNKTELGQRLCASQCEWCGTKQGPIEVHHVRKLKNLVAKMVWERHMIARKRKTLVLCKSCHVYLHAGRLSEATKRYGKTREPDTLNGVRPVRREVQ